MHTRPGRTVTGRSGRKSARPAGLIPLCIPPAQPRRELVRDVTVLDAWWPTRALILPCRRLVDIPGPPRKEILAGSRWRRRGVCETRAPSRQIAVCAVLHDVNPRSESARRLTMCSSPAAQAVFRARGSHEILSEAGGGARRRQRCGARTPWCAPEADAGVLRKSRADQQAAGEAYDLPRAPSFKSVVHFLPDFPIRPLQMSWRHRNRRPRRS